jgi:hypothetical protein
MSFVGIFAALAVAQAGATGTNVQLASNQRHSSTALHAAFSALECAKYIVSTADLGETGINYVTTAQADQAWADLCAHAQSLTLDGKVVSPSMRFTDDDGPGDELIISNLDLTNPNVQFSLRLFSLRLYRYDSAPRVVKMQATGITSITGITGITDINETVTRTVSMDMEITKDRSVLEYAIASRGRMWLTGDTTIHGDLYSSWDRTDLSPFNMTSDSTVLGTINTVLDLADIQAESWQMETLDANDSPIGTGGDPLGDNYADRYYGPNDEVKAYHEGINYGMPNDSELPGMSISDYNTDAYNSGLAPIGESGTQISEYFPHAPGDYAAPKYGSSHRYDRHVYENMTFTDALLPINRHALFRNCTFEGVLYVDCYKSSTHITRTNNVRFQDCTFNGVIVTDTPQPFDWIDNCLYFTGAATFNNQSSVQEATILAPHFNVNLGNTNPQSGDNNVLTGAIVGGIVDIRGNAQIYGTIVSMYDTTPHSSGYVTNIGATLGDGGSETTELGDVGVISITPEEDTMLPSGITSPIVIEPNNVTYAESI